MRVSGLHVPSLPLPLKSSPEVNVPLPRTVVSWYSAYHPSGKALNLAIHTLQAQFFWRVCKSMANPWWIHGESTLSPWKSSSPLQVGKSRCPRQRGGRGWERSSLKENKPCAINSWAKSPVGDFLGSSLGLVKILLSFLMIFCWGISFACKWPVRG